MSDITKFKEKLIFAVNKDGKFIGRYIIRMPCLVQADSYEELVEKAKHQGVAVISFYKEVMEQPDPFDPTELTIEQWRGMDNRDKFFDV